jgi:ribosomal protein S18 acetylase RimI-like enzyme
VSVATANAITPVGSEAREEMVAYLQGHLREAALLLADLARRDAPPGERLDVAGARRAGRIVAVQGFYGDGRWLPHFEDPAALDLMLALAQRYRLRWIMGPQRVVDAVLGRLAGPGVNLAYDEQDAIYRLDAETLRPHPVPGVRRATEADIPAVAGLRLRFDAEYFGTPVEAAFRPWYLRMAGAYVERGTYLAERDGVAVAMVAAEARIPALAQIGAVYTLPEYRARGLARGVITAITQDLLAQHPEVSLMVRYDNVPARRAYDALGFTPCGAYRMVHLAR